MIDLRARSSESDQVDGSLGGVDDEGRARRRRGGRRAAQLLRQVPGEFESAIHAAAQI
jgi:hypothetical protein